MSESDIQLIESSLEDLSISSNECPIDGQHIDVCCEPLIAEDIDRQVIETTVKTKSNSDFCCDQSLFNTSIENKSTDEDKEEVIQLEDNKSIDSEAKGVESSELSDSCEQMREVTKSGDNYKNTVVVNKYKLKHRWQLWFWRSDPGVRIVWHSALQRVSKPFETIEDFWRLYNQMVCVQHLISPSDYYMFKEGIEPMWEDRHNVNGGKLTLEFAKDANRLAEVWLEVLLCVVGEGFGEFGDEICGAVVNIRSNENRISVWTANAHKSEANLKIGETLKMRTRYEGQLKYISHSKSQRIAEKMDKQFVTKFNVRSKPNQKQLTRRSCAL